MSMAVSAVTVAVRGPPSSIATSPKKSPGPKVATLCIPIRHEAVPAMTITSSAARSPRRYQFPACVHVNVRPQHCQPFELAGAEGSEERYLREVVGGLALETFVTSHWTSSFVLTCTAPALPAGELAVN